MRKFLLVMLTLVTAVLFSCNPVNAQTRLIADGNSAYTGENKYTDTLTDAGTITFTTSASVLNAGVEGKYRLHFDGANISGTSTYKVVIHSRAYSGTGAGYSLHHKNAGTDGVNCDTLQVTAGVPASFDFNLVPDVVSNGSGAGSMLVSNAGRVVGIKVSFIGAGTQSTQIKNVAIITQK